jgi:hypothetical protein
MQDLWKGSPEHNSYQKEQIQGLLLKRNYIPLLNQQIIRIVTRPQTICADT